MIRRKSDKDKPVKRCRSYDELIVEWANQSTHETRLRTHPEHDRLAVCWCCCDDCTDLSWHYPPRKGTWWQLSPSGEPPSSAASSGG